MTSNTQPPQTERENMNAENEKTPASPTGRRYASVDALMTGEATSQDVRSKVVAFSTESKIVLQLAQLRQKAGITQEEMGKHLGVNQSAISKLESGTDEAVTLREIREYTRATGQRIGVMFGKPYTHVEAVRLHACGIKAHLESLAAIAGQDDQLEKEIKGFFSEAFFNILSILSACQDKLPPGGDFEVKFEIIKDNTTCAVNPRRPVQPGLTLV
jgi:transcriptional regulator with XRE-family HTH domain